MDRKDNKMKILRVIATLLVVVGHSNFYLISTNIRGLGYNASIYVIDHSRFWTLSSYLVGLIYSCHMQLFFVISGYVFALCLKKGKYKTFTALTTAKVHRLLIPYIAVTILYNIPILMCADYFSHNIRNVLLYFIGYGKNHLWYLSALFLIFLLVYSVLFLGNKMTFMSEKVTLVVLFFVALLVYIQIECKNINITEFVYLDRVAKYLVWFLFGMILYIIKKTSFYQYCKLRLNWCDVIILFFLWITSYLIGLMEQSKFAAIITSFIGEVFFYELCEFIAKKYKILDANKLINLIDKYSLEIYLYGVPLNYVILTALIQMCGKVELNNVQSSLLFILRFLIQLLGGIVIGMLIGNFQKVIKRGKIQSEKKQ